MAYIVVTTDKGTVVFKKHHSEYPVENGQAKLLNDLASAVLEAETYFEELRKKQREILGM